MSHRTMSQKNSVSPIKKVALFSTGHFVNDLHTAFLDTFLPYLVRNLGLSYTQAGILTSLSGLLHTVFQPIMGHVADRHTRPWPVMFGPIAAALGASMIPLSTSFTMALAVITLWGFGTASFHPQGQGSLGYVTPPSQLALAISLFGLGGMSGSTVSSLYAIALYRYLPHWAMPMVAVVPPIIMACLYHRYIPKIRDSVDRRDSSGMLSSLTSVFRLIYPIWAVTFLRDCSQRGLRFLLPLMIVAGGGNVTKVGTVLFSMSLIATVLPLIAARMAMRFGNVRVVKAILPAAGAILTVAWLLDNGLSLPLFIAGGALLTSCGPATDAMAQGMAPEKRSTASSLMMGFSFGLGGVAMAPLGWFSDLAGLRTALGLIAIMPLMSVPIMAFLWPAKKII